MFRKKYCRTDVKELSRYQRNQLKYDPYHGFFSEFPKHLRDTAKQAIATKAKKYVHAFSLDK